MVRRVPGTKKERAHKGLGEGEIDAGKFRTICSVHNEMFLHLKNLEDGPEKKKLITLLEEAFDCGIRMNNKLVEYARERDEGIQSWKSQVYSPNKTRLPKSKRNE